jgi:hypothetical protein
MAQVQRTLGVRPGDGDQNRARGAQGSRWYQRRQPRRPRPEPGFASPLPEVGPGNWWRFPAVTLRVVG